MDIGKGGGGGAGGRGGGGAGGRGPQKCSASMREQISSRSPDGVRIDAEPGGSATKLAKHSFLRAE